MAAQYSTISFAEGNRLDVYSIAPFYDAGELGVFLAALAQIRGNHATIRPEAGQVKGNGFEFEATLFQIQWAKMVSQETSIGAMAGFTSSATHFDSDSIEVARSTAKTYTFRMGAVHQFSPKLRFGVVAEYAAAPTRTRSIAVDPSTGIPQVDPVTFELIRETTKDTTHQALGRAGLTWEYARGCDLYLDYQGGAFWNDSGELWVHRFPLGVEQMLIPDVLWVRAGATFDTRGDTVLTAGLGMVLGPRGSFDFGYQRAAFPEVRPELGMAEMFSFSLTMSF